MDNINEINSYNSITMSPGSKKALILMEMEKKKIIIIYYQIYHLTPLKYKT